MQCNQAHCMQDSNHERKKKRIENNKKADYRKCNVDGWRTNLGVKPWTPL